MKLWPVVNHGGIFFWKFDRILNFYLEGLSALGKQTRSH